MTDGRSKGGFEPLRLLINLAGLALAAATIALIVATIIHEAG